MSRYGLSLCSLVLFSLATAAPQDASRRFRLSVDSVKPPEKAAKEPGDTVEIDSRTQDLIFKSRDVSMTIVRPVHVAPSVTVSWNTDGSAFTYSYRVTNAGDSKQDISLFSVDVLNGGGMEQSAPAAWASPTLPPSRSMSGLQEETKSVYSWSRVARDDDPAGRLAPGSTAGPFTLRTQALPGLVRLCAWGATEAPRLPAHANVSEWAMEALMEALRPANNCVAVNTIGPKISPSEDRLSAIQKEISFAAQVPEFRAISAALMAALRRPTIAQFRDAVVAIQGQTPIQKSFLNAMISNLK